jgi:hypothetical protein
MCTESPYTSGKSNKIWYKLAEKKPSIKALLLFFSDLLQVWVVSIF